MRHGAKWKLCSRDYCTKQAKPGGVCLRHGGRVKLFSKDGCTNKQVAAARPSNHDHDPHHVSQRKRLSSSEEDVAPKEAARMQRKRICTAEGSTTQAYNRGVCIKHGAKKRLCSAEGCPSNAYNGRVCVTHGAKRKECSHDGCTNVVINSGVCMRHGAKKKLCSSEGCTNYAKKGGICVRHGAKVKGNGRVDVRYSGVYAQTEPSREYVVFRYSKLSIVY